MVPHRMVLLIVGLAGAGVSGREVVNFDFGWRHMLGNSPSPPLRPCGSFETGFNWGTGGSSHKVADAAACCASCASNFACQCWDFNPSTSMCYTKQNCSTKVAADRVTGKFPPPPPSPPPPENPPQSAAGFDDASWEQVNAPHDMLIAQPYSPDNTEKMAFIARNVGWYRKHFSLPSEWQGQSVYLYFEGVFHETTVWLNGQKIAFHDAGYTSWWLRLDNVPGVKYGTEGNVLAAYVNASTGTGWWYEGGGLIRHVQLVAMDPVHIEPFGSWVHTNGSTFVTETTVENHGTAAASVAVKATVSESATGAVRATVTSNPVNVPAGVASSVVVLPVTWHDVPVQMWSVQTPNLYTVTFEVVSGTTVFDSLNITTGVRDVRFDADKGLFINEQRIKMRGFCDHSNFGGVGGAVPDRLQLYRAQALRAVGGNAWRMAHNPPSLSRLDYMDALGMLALDENRDYGGNRGQGGITDESVSDELVDMADMVRRDRSHPSVIWWSFCNEVGCNNESAAQAFREVAKLWDPTRAVTQNHHGTALSTDYLDVQGFSHKRTSDFVSFHASNPTKPMAATECCSCMSQRGIDQDFCPKPADGGCGGCKDPGTCPVFYNNNIGECTSTQVIESDSLDYVSGTFVWSGFDYLGEARGWPQNTKCRGTVADVAGFTKETAYWIKSVWQANISKSDPGRPLGAPAGFSGPDSDWTVFILESWVAPPSGTNRTINVYSNCPTIRLELNGKVVGTQSIPYFGMATFSVTFAEGALTAVGLDGAGAAVANYTIATVGAAAAVQLTLDAPAAHTGTGSALVADGEDTAMLRATIVDAKGAMVPGASQNMTFKIVSGPGIVWATHNGDPANDSPSLAPWTPAYHGLARAFVRSTSDHSTTPEHRRRLLQIDLDSNVHVAPPSSLADPDPIVVEVTVEGGLTAQVTIPVTASSDQLPFAVALREGASK
eukprot:m.326674 g.326674  ORF g.326674 m.326674 type:complete len:946 (-) comp16485_c0_seq4:4008-6845(-)